MKVDVVKGEFFRLFAVFEVNAVEIYAAVPDLGHGVFGICEAALFVEDLGDTVSRFG